MVTVPGTSSSWTNLGILLCPGQGLDSDAGGMVQWGFFPDNTAGPAGAGGATDSGYAAPGQAQYGFVLLFLSDSAGAPPPAPAAAGGSPQTQYTDSPGTSKSYTGADIATLVGAQSFPIRVWGIQNDNIYSDNVGSFTFSGTATGMSTDPQTATPASFAYSGASAYRLTWDAVTGATYNIYRDSAFIASTTDLFYALGMPAAGSSHAYQVSAVTTCGGESVLSGPITVTGPESPTLATPTPPPTWPGRCEGAQLTISWTAVSGATIYALKRNGATVYVGSGLSFVDTGAVVGMAYTYTVTASNSGGSSMESLPSRVFSPCIPYAPPSPPDNCTVWTSETIPATTWTSNTDCGCSQTEQGS